MDYLFCDPFIFGSHFLIKKSKYKGSQLFHMDNNDWRQIRVFYAINDMNLKMVRQNLYHQKRVQRYMHLLRKRS